MNKRLSLGKSMKEMKKGNLSIKVNTVEQALAIEHQTNKRFGCRFNDGYDKNDLDTWPFIYISKGSINGLDACRFDFERKPYELNFNDLDLFCPKKIKAWMDEEFVINFKNLGEWYKFADQLEAFCNIKYFNAVVRFKKLGSLTTMRFHPFESADGNLVQFDTPAFYKYKGYKVLTLDNMYPDVEKPVEIKNTHEPMGIHVDGKRVTVMLPIFEGDKIIGHVEGNAWCNPSDTFNLQTGIDIAKERALEGMADYEDRKSQFKRVIEEIF